MGLFDAAGVDEGVVFEEEEFDIFIEGAELREVCQDAAVVGELVVGEHGAERGQGFIGGGVDEVALAQDDLPDAVADAHEDGLAEGAEAGDGDDAVGGFGFPEHDGVSGSPGEGEDVGEVGGTKVGEA